MSKKSAMPKKPGFSLKNMGKLIKMLIHAYPAKLILVVICTLGAAMVNVLPAVFIKSMTTYIEEGLKLGWSPVESKIINAIVLMASLYIIGLIAITTQKLLLARLTQSFMHDMRTKMFSTMQRLPIRYFDSHSDGDIMSHYTNDIDTIRELIEMSLPTLFQASLTVLALIFIMLYYSMTLMVLVFLGIIAMFFVTKKVGGNSAKYFMRQQQSIGKVEGFIEETIHGQKVVKTFNHEVKALADFDVLNEELCEVMAKAHTYANSLGPITMNIGNILYVLVAVTGGLIVTSGGAIPNVSFEALFNTGAIVGTLSLPVICTFIGMTKQFSANVNQVAQQINSVTMAMAGSERIFELMEEKPEVDDGDVELVNCAFEDGVLVEREQRTGLWAWKDPQLDRLVLLEGDVRMNDVDFGYTEGKTVLHDVSLFAKPGQKIAFVGATGAGKTTITNLLNRFYDIADGKITYDGIDINRIQKYHLRRSMAIVLQDVNLFTGTVMDNIKYGCVNATEEDCIRAAELANADSFIRRLPDGYDTVLTDAGANLSQGQRQLLSIARAAVVDPPVMILDEATSSIDTHTEALVQAGMDELMKGRTVFVIAHRLSTVQNSNAIMVLDHGKIIERGDHDDLIGQHGVYYQLYTGAFELE